MRSLTRASMLLSSLMMLSLTACTSNGLSSENTDLGATSSNAGLPHGASKSEYIAAFDAIDPIDLDFQIASASADSYTTQRDTQFAEAISEWSGGKITVNIHYAGSIANPTDVPNALVDGRLDIAQYFTMYEPQQMAGFVDLASSMTQVPSSPLVGEIVSHAVGLEVANQTPEIVSEFTDRGLNVLYSSNPNGNTALICTTPKQERSDWQGTRIRGSASAQETQIEALGGILSSVEMAEGYEALERGVLDCSMQSPITATANGWVQIAPYVYFPEEQSFAPGPGSIVAGSSWDNLPLVAQQLIFDKLEVYLHGELYSALSAIRDLTEDSLNANGSIQYLDSTIEEDLSLANADLISSVESSAALDGSKLNAAVETSIEKWTAIAEELGYYDEGGFEEFSNWFEGPTDIEDEAFFEPIVSRIFQEVLLPVRPQ